MNFNFDSKLISTELSNSEQGFANIFKKYYKGHIIVSSVKNRTGFIWNAEKKVYEELSIEMINNDISNMLREAVQLMLNKIDAIDADIMSEKEKEKKKQPYNNLKALIGKANTVKSVYSYLLASYYNKEISYKMDNNDNIIPVKGGKLIDLSTGQVRERTHTDYFTYEKDVEYLGNEQKNTSNADRFFSQLSCNDAEKKAYLRLVMGSAITSYTKMKCFFILYGKNGNNGKSTLMELMEKVFSDLYVALPADLLYAENADKVEDTQFGTLIGKTIGTSIEPKNKYVNDPVIKLLTGSDSISCRKRFEDAISYTPKLKIFILLNDILRIGQTDIMKKRTRVINFDAEFVEKPNPKLPNQFKADPELASKFLSVWKSEFFTYIVNCAIEFLKSDNKMLNPPKVVDDEKNNYFNNMDYIGKALQEKFEFTKNPKDKVLRSEVAVFYELYCNENEKPFNKNKLKEYMIQLCGEASKTSGQDEEGNKVEGEYFYKGIKYKNIEVIPIEDVDDEKPDRIKELEELVKQQAEEIKQLKALLQAQVKKDPEPVVEEVIAEDLNEFLNVFNTKQAVNPTFQPEKKKKSSKPPKFVGNSKVVVESEPEDEEDSE